MLKLSPRRNTTIMFNGIWKYFDPLTFWYSIMQYVACSVITFKIAASYSPL